MALELERVALWKGLTFRILPLGLLLRQRHRLGIDAAVYSSRDAML
jgi:hypothetical protein